MMRSRGRRTLIGAVFSCLVVMGSDANAESVPLPVPAPHTKLRVAQPSAAPSVKPAMALPRVANKRVAQVTGAPPTPVPPATGVARPGATLAFDGSQRGVVDKVNAYLSSLSTLVGNFVQVGPDGGRTEGRFYLQKPGRVRFEYNPPSPVELIADGSSVAVRDRKLATQDIYPLSQTPLRFLLADRIDLLKDTNVVGASVDDTFVTVVIEERQTLGGTHRLMLMFGAKDTQLRQWTITDPQGYDTTVALYNLDAKQKPDPALFKIDYTRYNQ
jgi:outer membrane lipoprotein-sorting protein